MRARLEGRASLAAQTAWHTRNLKYAKDLPDLADYIKPPSKRERAMRGASKALAVFQAIAAKSQG